MKLTEGDSTAYFTGLKHPLRPPRTRAQRAVNKKQAYRPKVELSNDHNLPPTTNPIATPLCGINWAVRKAIVNDEFLILN